MFEQERTGMSNSYDDDDNAARQREEEEQQEEENREIKEVILQHAEIEQSESLSPAILSEEDMRQLKEGREDAITLQPRSENKPLIPNPVEILSSSAGSCVMWFLFGFWTICFLLSVLVRFKRAELVGIMDQFYVFPFASIAFSVTWVVLANVVTRRIRIFFFYTWCLSLMGTCMYFAYNEITSKAAILFTGIIAYGSVINMQSAKEGNPSGRLWSLILFSILSTGLMYFVWSEILEPGSTLSKKNDEKLKDYGLIFGSAAACLFLILRLILRGPSST